MDIQNLTLGEIAKIESLSGLSINAIQEESSPKGFALAALAFVIKLRENPAYTWNDACGLTATEANEILTGGADAEADAPKAETPKKSAKRV